ncbi:hypothetical protein M0R04_15710 [Candidatus Dojkabacteria bacterium]|jgi:hypothetical protein|nr:hypothetical protein [Candidatus Dojkabacteria bacterium]
MNCEYCKKRIRCIDCFFRIQKTLFRMGVELTEQSFYHINCFKLKAQKAGEIKNDKSKRRSRKL